jgi:hypothetical protein
MNNTFRELIVIAVIFCSMTLATAFGNYISKPSNEQNVGIASTPSQGQIATSSTIQVGPQQVKTIFEANESCMTRVVGTRAQEIILTFDVVNLSDLTPSFGTGFPISASTTRELPSERFGCGPVKAYAAASTTITKAETVR